jgi:hypothetical protein
MNGSQMIEPGLTSDALRHASGRSSGKVEQCEVRFGVCTSFQTEPTGGVLACIEDREADCPIVPVCRLRKVLAEAEAEFYKVIDHYTLADLLAHPTALSKLLLRDQRA